MNRALARLASLFVAVLLLTSSFIAPRSAEAADFRITLGLRVSGLTALAGVVSARDGTDRLFLVERQGTVRVYEKGP